MNNLHYIIILVLIILLIVTNIKNCSPIASKIQTDTIKVITPAIVQTTHDSIPYFKYIPRLSVIHDTIYRDGKALSITPERYCEENFAFTSVSNQQVFLTGDSLTATFHYPEKVFDFDYRSKPDTSHSITKTITITEKQSPFKLVIGVGANLMLDGTVKFGIFGGVGYTVF